MVAQDVARGVARLHTTGRPPAARPATAPISQTAAFCNLAAATILVLAVLAYLLFA